ncbi:MAG: hypothetical protein HYY18_05570 [Planctomycetes bacterium]|nr:hypothetical protein [Planctomycetota bacterium]
MPQPPGGQPPPRPSSVKPGAAAPRPAAVPPRPSSVVKPASGAKPASVVKPASGAVPPPSAKPSGGTQKLAAPAPAESAPVGAAPPPGSAKFLRPTKMQAALAEAANKPPEDPTKRTWKFWFNLGVILSIPICIVIISWGALKKIRAGGKATDIVTKVVEGGKGEDPNKPKVTDHLKILEDAKENLLKVAQTKVKQAEHANTPADKIPALLAEAEKLAVEYAKVVEPIITDERYKGPEFSWITEDHAVCMQLIRVIRDRKKALEPEEALPPAQPNTRALGIIASWNGTSQKLAVIFLGKDISPTDPTMTSMEFEGTLGRITIRQGDSDKPLALVALPGDRIWELLRGTVKEEVEKLDIEGRKKRAGEMAADIKYFEGAKFGETLSYATSVNGYFFKDQVARIVVRIHDDRGIECFKEYYDLILQAIGTPTQGSENVSASFAERKMLWRKEGVIYHVQAIGTKSGMDLTLTTWSEANWKALSDFVGETDAFQDQKLEAWGDRTPAEVPK